MELLKIHKIIYIIDRNIKKKTELLKVQFFLGGILSLEVYLCVIKKFLILSC